MAMPIGRRRELEAVELALDAAAAGRRGVLVVRGAAGIGKSTLVDAARALAAARGARVLSTGLSAAETGLSWAGLSVLLRPLTGDPLAVLPDAQAAALRTALGRSAGESDPLLVAAGLARLLGELAADAPAMVVVDDLHWLDSATAGALAYAIRTTDDARLLFLLAGRPVSSPLDVERLVPPDRLTTVELEGLSVAGLKMLLEERFEARLTRVQLVRLHGITGGNPLHALEAGRLLAAGQSFDHAAMPPSLQAVVREHVGLLSPPAADVVRVAALSARPTVPLLQRVHPAPVVEAALVEAERAGIVRVDDDAISFVHPTLIAGVLDSMGSYERRRLEATLAEVAESDEERALHLAASVGGHDTTAAVAVAAAAEAAARRGAVLLAAERMARACALVEPGDVDRLRSLRLRLADLLQVSGDGRRAMDVYRTVLDSSPTDEERWEAVVGLAIATAHALGEEHTFGLLDDIDAAAGDDLARRADAARIRSRIMLHRDIAVAERAALEFVRLRSAAGTTPVQALEAEAMLAVVQVLRAEPVDLDHLHRRASLVWPDAPETVTGLLMEPLVWADRFDLLGDHLEHLSRAAEGASGPLELLNAIDQLADLRMRLGHWKEAQAALELFCETSIAAFDGMAIVPRLAELAYLDAVRGVVSTPPDVDLPGSRRVSRVEAAQRSARLGMAALALGDAERAAAFLAAAHADLLEVGLLDTGALPFRADLVEALTSLGRTDEAAPVLAHLRWAAARSGRARSRAEAARGSATVLAAEGDLDAAQAECEAAADGYAEVGAVFERARSLLLAGQVARRSGRRSDARSVLTEARAVFDGLGAVPFLRRTDDELARCGGDVASPSGVTPTERQIAGLVAAGRTNAEIAAAMFISVRTVESNLTKLYRKLGVRSRTELLARLKDPSALE